jgi:hydrogenase/urease accessory protein HupE
VSAWLRALFWACLALAPLAQAHEMSMAELELRETAKGQFIWLWAGGGDKRAPGQGLTPRWPDGCVAETNALRCGEGGLRGTLEIDGVGKNYSAALVKIFWLDGQARVYTLTGSQTSVQLFGSANDPRGQAEIATAYAILGVEHILGGIDHLLFVLSLLFLVGFQRRLVWTITAFTAAHSLTLASAALGWLTLSPPPVEATIALSIVLVAGEALHKRETVARRWPAVVALLFGLVHGLGFAGALKEIGLPENYLPTALLTFNIGVEVGQLMTVAVAWLIWLALRRWPLFLRGRAPVLYGIGSVAAYWFLSRAVAIFT